MSESSFTMTPEEAKKFRRKHRSHGALVLIVLCICAYTAPSLIKKIIRVITYYDNHVQKYIKCSECQFQSIATKPIGMSVSKIKENNFRCPYCDKQHGNRCPWCQNELF